MRRRRIWILATCGLSLRITSQQSTANSITCPDGSIAATQNGHLSFVVTIVATATYDTGRCHLPEPRNQSRRCSVNVSPQHSAHFRRNMALQPAMNLLLGASLETSVDCSERSMGAAADHVTASLRFVSTPPFSPGCRAWNRPHCIQKRQVLEKCQLQWAFHGSGPS
jgi:hypothetical protein